MFRLIKSILRLIVLALITCGLLFTYARYVEPKMLLATEVIVPRAPKETHDLTVVAFADTHFSQYYTPKDFKRAVKRINELNPDLVFFLGDLIDNYNDYVGDTQEISALLSEIHATTGKFAVFGNHDYGGGSQKYYKDIMNAGGFQVLINETYDLTSAPLRIIGIDDMLIGYGKPEVAANTGPGYNIVLCHEPDLLAEIEDYSADFMLAGHTHGKQVDVPFLEQTDLLPPYGKLYPRGLYSIDNQIQTQLYVTAGIGTTKLPLRFRCVPEIVHIKFVE